MKVNLCRHIKTNGLQCHGVQLTGSEFCYFHRRLHRSHDVYRDQVYFHPARVHHTTCIDLPAVEDRESAQLAISCVINALASGYIDRKQANSLFYGLQLATTNARGLRIVRRPAQMVRDFDKESWGARIPEASPDLAPAGRTVEIKDPTDPTDPAESNIPELNQQPAGNEGQATPQPGLELVDDRGCGLAAPVASRGSVRIGPEPNISGVPSSSPRKPPKTLAKLFGTRTKYRQAKTCCFTAARSSRSVRRRLRIEAGQHALPEYDSIFTKETMQLLARYGMLGLFSIPPRLSSETSSQTALPLI